jgi:peptide/nickel transport system permease protein
MYQAIKLLKRAPLSPLFGLVVILAYLLVALTAPIISPFGESEIVGAEYQPWGDQFLLGTDALGRDIASRLIYGAIVTTILTFLLGAITGFLAATLGGWVDQILSRIIDILMSIPPLIFALLILAILGPSITTLILTIAVLYCTRVYRIARAAAANIVVMD